jgi:quercetin dioxygenase-like cupin family protein
MNNIKIVPKGWGHEKWIVNNDKYCGKLLFFNKGKRCSWHFHKIKDETFYLQSGLISLYYGWEEDLSKSEVLILEPGDSFHIPIGLKHQMVALEDSELFEFSTEHFDSDSYRIISGDSL